MQPQGRKGAGTIEEHTTTSHQRTGDEQGTTRSMAALHGTALAVGGLLGALLTATVIDRWGRGKVIRMSAIGAAA